MSQKSRRKSRRDSNYPKDRHSQSKCDYMGRQKAMKAAILEKFDCHVHTRRIYRYGLRPDMLVTISRTHHTSHLRMTHAEALEILRSFQAEFREMGQIRFEMRR